MKEIIFALIIYDCFKFILKILTGVIARKKDPAKYDEIAKRRKEQEKEFDTAVGGYVQS